jgi:hypothetical protein
LEEDSDVLSSKISLAEVGFHILVTEVVDQRAQMGSLKELCVLLNVAEGLQSAEN